MSVRKYVTAFAGARDSYQVPLALAQSDQLDCLVTDLYLPRLPKALTTHYLKLARRSAPGLSVLDTRSSARVLWRSYVGWRFAKNRAEQQLLDLKWCQNTLGRLAGERALRNGSDLFLYAGYALEAFKDPRLGQTRRILFMYHPHIARSSEILIEDVSQYPEAQSSLTELAADQRDRDVDRELELADLVVCASEFTASTVRAIGIDAEKIAVIPYGIDVSSAFVPQKSRDVCHFLFVGTGIHRKGLHILCDAWKQAQLSDARLTIVSRYIDPWIRARAEVPGITVRSGVDAHELNELYDDANVFVLPSLIEGFGYVYLEALARGCMCIGTENTGLPDLGLSPSEALVVPSGDRDTLARAIISVYTQWRAGSLDPGRIREAVSKWTWARFRTSVAERALNLAPPAPAVPISQGPRQLHSGKLKFSVLQVGARMHYAVPVLLQRADMLCHFYTDVTGNRGSTGAFAGILPARIYPAPIRRLFARRLPAEVPSSRVTTADALALRDGLLRKMISSPPSWTHAATESLRRRILSDDFRGADAFYCLDNGDLDVIREAKRRGLVVVYEQTIAPQVGRIMREERALYPGLERQESEAAVEVGIQRDNEVWNLADLTIAPSEFVRDGMISLGADPKRIAMVPYGLPENWYGSPTRPEVGRILFVGSVGLRKGSHYLAAARRSLFRRGLKVDFRVVGPFDSAEIATPEFSGPDYVGLVVRDVVREEFSRADVFVLPTIAEGSALVHLEALANGVPVVTTPNCGSVVRDGEDGFIVPIRDVEALADRIERIVSDRSLRDRLSENARTRAEDFSWSKYHARLTSALMALKPTGRRGGQ